MDNRPSPGACRWAASRVRPEFRKTRKRTGGVSGDGAHRSRECMRAGPCLSCGAFQRGRVAMKGGEALEPARLVSPPALLPHPIQPPPVFGYKILLNH